MNGMEWNNDIHTLKDDVRKQQCDTTRRERRWTECKNK